MIVQSITTFTRVGASEDIVCNASGGAPKKLFAGSQSHRQGIVIVNHNAASKVIYKWVNAGSPVPSVTPTSNYGRLDTDGKPVFIGADLGIDVYVISLDAGTPELSACEVG